MKKIFVFIFTFWLFFSVFADSQITLTKDKYRLYFENINSIEEINHNKNNKLRVNGKNISIKIEGNKIYINGKQNSKISEISFPNSVEFTLIKGGQSMTFKKGALKIKSEEGNKVIEIKDKKILVKDKEDTVRIDEDGIFIDSADGEHVQLGKNGLMIEEKDEVINLGFLGKLIGNIAGKIAHYAVQQSMNYNDILNKKLNNYVKNESLIGTQDLNINIDEEEIKKIKQKAKKDIKSKVLQIEKYVYKNITDINLELISSSYIVKKSASKNVELKILKSRYPKNYYKIEITQNKQTLNIKEELETSFNDLDVKFILSVPQNTNIKLDSTSGDGTITGVSNLKNLIIKSTSGDLKIYNTKKINSTKINIISGDLIINSLKGDKLSVNTTSGDIVLKDLNVTHIDVGVISGDLILKGVESVNFIFDSVSGDLEGTNCNIHKFKADTTSGDIQFKKSKIKSRIFKSVSGDFNISRIKKQKRINL